MEVGDLEATDALAFKSYATTSVAVKDRRHAVQFDDTGLPFGMFDAGEALLWKQAFTLDAVPDSLDFHLFPLVSLPLSRVQTPPRV